MSCLVFLIQLRQSFYGTHHISFGCVAKHDNGIWLAGGSAAFVRSAGGYCRMPPGQVPPPRWHRGMKFWLPQRARRGWAEPPTPSVGAHIIPRFSYAKRVRDPSAVSMGSPSCFYTPMKRLARTLLCVKKKRKKSDDQIDSKRIKCMMIVIIIMIIIVTLSYFQLYKLRLRPWCVRDVTVVSK